MHIKINLTWMLCNAYDDMASFSYHNTRGVTVRFAEIWLILMLMLKCCERKILFVRCKVLLK
jgi:hypothetical protein